MIENLMRIAENRIEENRLYFTQDEKQKSQLLVAKGKKNQFPFPTSDLNLETKFRRLPSLLLLLLLLCETTLGTVVFKFLLLAFPVVVAAVVLLFVEGRVVLESLRRAMEPVGDDDVCCCCGDDEDDERIPVAPAFRVGGGMLMSSVA